jgi:hypothetical protein
MPRCWGQSLDKRLIQAILGQMDITEIEQIEHMPIQRLPPVLPYIFNTRSQNGTGKEARTPLKRIAGIEPGRSMNTSPEIPFQERKHKAGKSNRSLASHLKVIIGKIIETGSNRFISSS